MSESPGFLSDDEEVLLADAEDDRARQEHEERDDGPVD